MKAIIIKPTTVNIQYLEAYFGDIFVHFYDKGITILNKTYYSLEELQKDYPDLVTDINGELNFILTINVDNGEVITWPKNSSCDFYAIKLVDTGHYVLRTDEYDLVASYDGYVPSCFGDLYGDYLEFEIDNNSCIPNWEFTQESVTEFMSNIDNSNI